jgi:hypothetical protein
MPFTYAIAATPPPPDSLVAAAISPLKEAVADLSTTADIRGAMAALEAAMASAQSDLNQLLRDPEPASAEELVDQLKRTVRVSMLTALLGSTGIVDLARSEFDARQQELKHPPPQSRWVELAIEPVRAVSSRTDTAVSIEDVYQSAAPGVQGLLQAMRGQLSPPRRLDVQRLQGAQWISYVYSEWNDHYRDELAKVWDCSPRDFVHPFFGELAKIRNDFIHNSGIAKRTTANCKILNWFSEGDQMFLTTPMYVDVLRNWPWDELTQRPKSIEHNRSQYKGQAPIALVDEVNNAAVAAGIAPDAVIEGALTQWLRAHRMSQPTQ